MSNFRTVNNINTSSAARSVEQLSSRSNQKMESDNKSKSFFEHLSESIKDVNALQNKSNELASDLATGKKQNIQETMLALTEAELSFNLMVQVRNKALEAYNEVMRMPV